MTLERWMELTDDQRATYTDAYHRANYHVLAGRWHVLDDPHRQQWRTIYTQRITDGYSDAAATNMAWSQIAKEIALDAAHQAIGMQPAPAAEEVQSQQSAAAPRRGSGVPAPCHPDRRNYARSMCRTCYSRWRYSNSGVPATCHPDRPHYARSMCRSCYRRHRKLREANR